MAKEEVVTEKLDPLGPVDYLMEEVLGIPGIGSVLKIMAPATVADALGVPTPSEIFEATTEKLKSRVEEKIAR
ncbi:MAG: hypothetical protein N2V75_00030 [Methanophagales archaeon]|nr:hypothetical protein [Methanophagales archaeon]